MVSIYVNLLEQKKAFAKEKSSTPKRLVWKNQHGRRFIVLEHQYGRRDVMWKHPIDLFSMYFLFSKCRSFDNTQRTLSFEFSSYSCAYEKTKGQIPLRPNLHRENSKSTWRASQVVVVGGGGGTPYNGLYEEAPPKRGTLFRLHVKSVRGFSLPLWNFLEYAPPAPRVPDSAEVLTPPWWFALCPEVFSRGIATGPAGCGSWSGW